MKICSKSFCNCKLSNKGIFHILEYPCLKTMTTKVDEDMEQLELSLSAYADVTWYSPFGGRLAVAYKTKDSLIIQSSNHVLWYLAN